MGGMSTWPKNNKFQLLLHNNWLPKLDGDKEISLRTRF